MWSNSNNNGRERSIAVAINKDKPSQYAFKWALDHVVARHETVRLVHVKERPLSPPVHKDNFSVNQQFVNSRMGLLLPFRCFCRRRQIECETIILEDVDVAKALIEYVCQHGVDTLILGSAPRNSLSRLFRATDVPGNVLKWAPDFCSVYVISKGKINSVRAATRPVPALATNGGGGLLLSQPNSTTDPTHNTRGYDRWYDEMQTVDQIDNPFTCSGRPSTDSNLLHFYENLGCSDLTSRRKSNLDDPKFFESPHRQSPTELIDSVSEHYNDNLDNDQSSWSSSFNNLQDLYEGEMRRLKMELKQTIDMYHTACKEAIALKQKVSELEEWKRREEAERLEEKERQQKTMAMEAVETVEKLVEKEVQKRMYLKENEEKKKVLDALGQSHVALKYQSLYHMIAVLFVFYFYFTMFN